MTRDEGPDRGIDDAYAADAEEIGLLAINLGEETSVTAALDNRVGGYDPMGDIALPGGTHADVYRYVRDGETRYAVETVERTATGEVRYHSYVFTDEPSAEDVSRATLIAEASLSGGEDA